jgi:integrase
MQERIKTQQRNKNYDTTMRKFQQREISDTNRAILNDYKDKLLVTAQPYRVAKIIGQIMRLFGYKVDTRLGYKETYVITPWNNIDFRSITTKDIDNIIAYIKNNNEWANNTKSDYRRCLKQFLGWHKLNSQNKYDESVYNYKIKIAYENKTADESDIITDEDIVKIIQNGTNNIRDRAILAVLHESGARAEELLNLKIKDVSDDFSKIIVDGKTGKRTIPIKVLSPTYLMGWMNIHPHKENPQAYLWVYDNKKDNTQPIKYSGLVLIIQRCWKKAVSKLGNESRQFSHKKHNLHWFRHSRLTINGMFMSDSMMRVFAGWTAGSDMTSIYVHAGYNQLEETIEKFHGIKKDTVIKTAHQCPRCSFVNPNHANFCSRCASPLTTLAHEQKKQHEDFAWKLSQAITENPKLLEKFNQFKATRQSL